MKYTLLILMYEIINSFRLEDTLQTGVKTHKLISFFLINNFMTRPDLVD